MKTIVRKIGKNRGKPRLWIEGKALIEAGFKHGDLWDLRQNETGFEIVRTDAGKRKIAGKPDRPIIDIVGGSLGDLSNVEKVNLEFVPGSGFINVKKG